MVEISLVEYAVYGFICYFSLAMMVILSIKDNIPTSRLNSGVRMIFIMPGLVCSILLTGGFTEVVIVETRMFEQGVTNGTAFSSNSTGIQTIALQDYSTFSNVHFMIFLMFFIWLIHQTMQILTRAGHRSDE